MATPNQQDPFLAREIGAELANIAHHKAEQARTSGVHFGGMEASAFFPRTVGQIQSDAAAARQRAEAFATSPRGVFLKALSGVAEFPSYEADAERLRALYSRDLADARKPLNVAAVGSALLILNEIPGKDARRAIDALGELLLQTQKEAA